jgi:hypothetical protein
VFAALNLDGRELTGRTVRMRQRVLLATAAAIAATAGLLAPTAANAAGSGSTVVTGTVGITGLGVVSIVTTPAAVLTQSGSNLTGSLGLTTVTDTQIANPHSWTVTIKSTDFTMVGATSNIPTIAATNASVSMAAPTVAVPGTATVSSYPTSGSPLSLSNTDQNLVQASATNANVVTYTPSISFAVPNGQTVGAYTGTVTQTVS